MAFYVGISARQHYIGRYIAGLTWYAAITGQPVDAIKYNPAPEEKYSIEDLPVGGVRKTVNPPYEIFIGRIFAYSFDAEASKAPSDEGAVIEAD